MSACGWMRTGLTAIRSVLPMIPSHTTQARQTHKTMMKGSKQTRLTLTQFRLQSKAAKKQTKTRLNANDRTRAWFQRHTTKKNPTTKHVVEFHLKWNLDFLSGLYEGELSCRSRGKQENDYLVMVCDGEALNRVILKQPGTMDKGHCFVCNLICALGWLFFAFVLLNSRAIMLPSIPGKMHSTM